MNPLAMFASRTLSVRAAILALASAPLAMLTDVPAFISGEVNTKYEPSASAPSAACALAEPACVPNVGSVRALAYCGEASTVISAGCSPVPVSMSPATMTSSPCPATVATR